MSEGIHLFIGIGVWLLILFGLLLLGRKIVWWYFGIGRAIRALESIDASLRQLPAVRRFDHSSGRRAAKVA